jgi:hypothetical protein
MLCVGRVEGEFLGLGCGINGDCGSGVQDGAPNC